MAPVSSWGTWLSCVVVLGLCTGCRGAGELAGPPGPRVRMISTASSSLSQQLVADIRSASPSVHRPRDVRPVYFGSQGILDPNAGLGAELPESEVEPGNFPPPATQRLFGGQSRHRQASVRGLPDPLVPAASAGIAPEEEPAWSPGGDLPPPLIAPESVSGDQGDLPANPQEEPPAGSYFSFRQDMHDSLPNIWNDTCSIFTWKNAAILTVAAGGAVAIRESGVDAHVRQETAEHPERWGSASQTLRQFGEYSVQVPVLFGLYGYSLWQHDADLYDYTRATISAYAINVVATGAIKGLADTSRPTKNFEGGRWGFPSFHSSSLFTIASVTEEYYGCEAGVPLYILAGLVGWSRIDQREHDLSDVLFGAVLGYVIGKSVGGHRLEQENALRWQVQPYYEPQNNVSGVAFEKHF